MATSSPIKALEEAIRSIHSWANRESYPASATRDEIEADATTRLEQIRTIAAHLLSTGDRP